MLADGLQKQALKMELGSRYFTETLDGKVEQMEKALKDSKGANPTWDVLQSLVQKFNSAPAQAGKVPVEEKQVLSWLNNRRRLQKGKKALVPETSNSITLTLNDDLAKIATTNSDKVLSAEWENVDKSKLEFEARSSKDRAWYDVECFRKHRVLKSGEKEVRVRFVGLKAEHDEWINVKNAVRLRSLACEGSDCQQIMPGDLICCFKEISIEEAKYFDAHVLKIKRKQHDIRGCRCKFLIRYDHDHIEEIVPLQRVCRRPDDDFIYAFTENVNK